MATVAQCLQYLNKLSELQQHTQQCLHEVQDYPSFDKEILTEFYATHLELIAENKHIVIDRINHLLVIGAQNGGG